MRIRLPKAASGNLPQKVIAVLLLLGVIVEIAGIPVVGTPRKDRSRPYPCQDRPCGCASAEECWHHCCCMSNKEKLVWASAHGVTPPDFVVAAAAEEKEQPTEICDHEECGTCAASGHGEERACCKSRHGHDHATAASDTSKSDKHETDIRLVLTDFARRCSGLPQIILLFADALPCVASAQWKPVEGPIALLIDVPGVFPSIDLLPPVPPPKLSGGVAA